ncbi:sodium-dependent glucose transporter 1-like [Haliotis rubra]|uniref:sodium-dependent glucose transporter 1-like n=1 Tax=Haliotis rubra TaxID=36100 RepID=UPI001EE5D0A8|nr:sodium-dependent glucose transporter 1-like [Haliotis rubra]
MRSRDYRKKFLYTACLLFGNFMSGWVNGQRGPSLLDLQIITGTDLSQGSAFFTAAATGSVVGAVAGGAIYDRFNKYLSLFISMAGHGLTVAVIPLCSPYWLMITMFAVHEFFLGIFKTGVFPAMLTWIEKDFVELSGKIMSVIFIAVGLGGMVNPQIIGHLMQVYSPLWYNYVLTIESVLLFLSFLMLVWLVKKVLSKHHLSYTDTTDTAEEMEEPLDEDITQAS